ncbi:hypothetical protein ASE95_02500 [Sphingomonas sp. Leaf231]|uniref:DUF3060 domain-containing protein n=1 Tax=Sphingomonas sp. Leaf231 TaxID=1736301 RepID=UPI0006FAC085|nr:DUF3060 domain-containing protein [Sphingomonas sp. Leaf231]KQN93804.1 hypothetical protein ASE95_02500 [Sphingomonas sp. Leaf231]
MMLICTVLATATLSGASAAQTTFEGAGQESRLDCDGGEAHITGASNRITVDGPCELLSVEGAGNIVSVDLSAKSAIRVVGSSNRITWRAPEKARPRISSTGAGNSIRRAQ